MFFRNLRNFDDFYQSMLASNIASTSGSLSSIFSLLIMYIIIRSEKRLSSSYHRIMFFMSFWDLVTSVSIAFTTMPMPIDNLLEFEKGSVGNTFSCSLQGFLAYVGSCLGILSFCILNIFYLCKLRYKIQEELIRKYVETIGYVVSIVISLYPGIQFWKNGLINPAPYEPYCTIGPYPFWCQYGPDNSCVRGEEVRDSSLLQFLMYRYLFLVIVAGFCTTIVSMTLIVHAMRSDAKTVAKATFSDTCASSSNKFKRSSLRGPTTEETTQENPTESESSAFQRAQNAYHNSRVAMIQALMYVVAFVLTWIFNVLTFRLSQSITVATLKVIFNPLQGFFNGMIFVGHKVHNVLESNPGESLCSAFYTVFFHPNNVPGEVYISKIELVDMEAIYNRLRRDEHHEKDFSYVGYAYEETSKVNETNETNTGTYSGRMTSSPLDKRSSVDFSSRGDAHSQLSCRVAESIEMHSLSDRSDPLSLPGSIDDELVPIGHAPTGQDSMQDIILNNKKLSSFVSVNSDDL